MSTLYVATGPVPLADRLADLLDRHAREGDAFAPVTIVVPNRYLGKWLRFGLARRHGIAINLRFAFLERTLWDMLRAVDPRAHRALPELLDDDTYRLLVLAVLLGESDPDLAPLHAYFRGVGGPETRRYWRRAWQLADMLANLIRDYEYHRQDFLIQPWIKQKLVMGNAVAFEKSQRAVFDHIIRLPDGKRDLLFQKTGRNFKTLPQYAMEVLEELERQPARRPADPTTIHLFGLSQISALHVSTLRWLGRFFDLRLYHLNPLAASLPTGTSAQTIAGVADAFRQTGAADTSQPGDALLRAWGRAAAESFWLMGQLAAGKTDGFRIEVVATEVPARPARGRRTRTDSVLGRLQKHLLRQDAAGEKLAQDPTLQIVGCPGSTREVETVHQSILYNLQNDPALQLTDIAVLVTDMEKYRPTIQAVFERPPRHIDYNLIDYSAGRISTFGQAVLGMLDLAQESFTRTRVFEVLLNPCFLARVGVDRTQALTWAEWARGLGIYQGWNAQEKKERGYASSERYGWQLGLQRLRLGRYMEASSDATGRPAPRFGDLVPFADLASQDREQLDAFSRAVEGLLPELVRLRSLRASGQAWGETLRFLVENFLDVPDDRPEEAQVRDRLLTMLEDLPLWDCLQGRETLPLALIREFVHDHLEAIEGRQGEYLAGGVTIAPLAKVRPVPFSVVYLLGLGEAIFPGSNALSSLDLRDQRRLPGDIRPAELKTFLFLETLLAARHKLYLLYNNRDLQRDQKLLPAVPVVQLERFLNEHVLREKLVTVQVPLHDHDPESVMQPPVDRHDAGIHFQETDRLLALAQARRQGAVSLDLFQEADFKARWRRSQPDFALPVEETAGPEVPAVHIKELKGFLENPVLAACKRHLHLAHDEDDDSPADDEPFVSSSAAANRITRHVLEAFVLDATTTSLVQALRDWPERFRALYEEEGLRCRVPEVGFGAADQAYLFDELNTRITDSLVGFLENRHPADFCGPVLLGQSRTPLGARRRFPALTLPLPRPVPHRAFTQVRLSGSLPLVWVDAEAENFYVLVLTNRSKLDEDALSAYLFEPVLLYLGLQANAATFPGANSSQEWLRASALHVHVCWKGGLPTYTYSFTPQEAGDYLGDLVADFLDPTTFDLLPFDVVAGSGKKPDLCQAYTLPDQELGSLPEHFGRRLQEKIDESTGEYGNYWRKPLVELARARVPPDAFAKIRRRFRPLDRGPADRRKDSDEE